MRLLSAAITNFRLLREIELKFSIDRERALTVIRAENRSGKTSTLKALKWALFGSKEGLDSQAERLSPIDWPENKPCEVIVRIDFEHTLPVEISAQAVSEETRRYTLRRTVTERPVEATFTRGPDRVELFEHTDAGAEPIPGAETRLREILPVEMKNIFFTDGDSALSFISSDAGRTTKIDQVKNAIRSLLGLGLLEDVESALRNARGRLLKAQRDDSPLDELARVTKDLQEKESERDSVVHDLTIARSRSQELDHRLAEADKDYE